MYKKHHFLRFCLLLTAFGYADISNVHAANTVYADRPSENIPVNIITIPAGDTARIPISSIDRYLISEQKIAKFIGQNDTNLEIQGVTSGQTMVLVWSDGGLATYRLIVTPSKKQVQENIESEHFAMKQRLNILERSLKIHLESIETIQRSGRDFAQLKESSKVVQNAVEFSGALPIAHYDGRFQYEYRKDALLSESVMMPRDFNIEFSKINVELLKDSKVIVGSKYVGTNEAAMTKTRLEGVAVVEADREEGEDGNPIPRPEKYTHFTVLAGRERDGTDLDATAGSRNRKLKDQMLATMLTHQFIDELLLQGGSAHRWTGIRSGQSDWNYFTSAKYQHDLFSIESSFGVDDQNHHSSVTSFSLDGLDGFLGNLRYKDVNKHYMTVSGSGVFQGDIGLDWSVQNRLPVIMGEGHRLDWHVNGSLNRNRLFVNPDNVQKFNRLSAGNVVWSLPDESSFEYQFHHENAFASGFPHIRNGRQLGYRKTFSFDNPWISSFGIDSAIGMNRYDKAKDSSGFNANRYHYQFGGDLRFLETAWLSLQHRRIYLHEETPDALPDRIRPKEFVISGGMYHDFDPYPFSFSWSVSESLRKGLYGKQHELISAENTTDADFQFEWNTSQGIVFANLNFSNSRPIMGGDKNVDMTMVFGYRAKWDTGLYIKGAGNVRGCIFEDLNSNLKNDAGDKPFDNMLIEISGQKVLSDELGCFDVQVKEGEHVIELVSDPPKGFLFQTTRKKTFLLRENEDYETNFILAGKMQISGRVYIDVNENKKYDQLDEPLAGVVMELDTGQTVRSKSLGYYSSLNVEPGTRKLSIKIDSVPQGYRMTVPASTSLTGESGDSIEYDIPFVAQRIVSGQVFYDANKDGLYTTGESYAVGAVIHCGEYEAKVKKNGRFYLSKLKPGDCLLSVEAETIDSQQPFTLPDPLPINIPRLTLTKMDADIPVTPTDAK